MEKVSVQCLGCKARLKFTPKVNRVSIKCPRCGEKIAVDARSSESESLASTAASSSQQVKTRAEATSDAERKSPRTATTSPQRDSDRNRGKQDSSGDRQSSGRGVVVTVIACAVCIAAAVGGTLWFLGGDGSQSSEPGLADRSQPDSSGETIPSGGSEPEGESPATANSAGVNVVVRDTDALSYDMKVGDHHIYQMSMYNWRPIQTNDAVLLRIHSHERNP